MKEINIWWIRRDIRLLDNPALKQALDGDHIVLPVFILDPKLLHRSAPKRNTYLFSALRNLQKDLEGRGSRLVVRDGDPRDRIPELVHESGARVVYAIEDYSPYARQRDEAVGSRVDLRWVAGQTVFHPGQIKTAEGKPYTVFTPFSRAWKALAFPDPGSWRVPGQLTAPPDLISHPIPPGMAPEGFAASEQESQRTLYEFVSGPIHRYQEDRNRMDIEGTSRLSSALRFGLLSPRVAASEALKAIANAPDEFSKKGAETWLNELIWREFYQSILYHFPFVLSEAFNPSLRSIRWQGSSQDLRAWQEGRTGYPVVDAAMRQLERSGWMHNRARMIVASFLVKDMLIDWREGERWFMAHLVDGDPAANNGGWQWTAGVGTDAAPYFRIFNPVLQGKKFDPFGAFVRTWLPELAGVPNDFIHTPWLMPESLQQSSRCIIGVDYPAPIVDHAVARERTLAAYRGKG
jgi:deoxyribodipyrimidine photo-lyase